MTSVSTGHAGNPLRVLYAALAEADLERYRAAFTTDAVIWHNYDQHEQTVTEHVTAVNDALTTVRTMEIVPTRAYFADDVVVEQVNITSTLIDERVIRFPGCIIARCFNGLIYRLDEYIDTGTITTALAAPPST